MTQNTSTPIDCSAIRREVVIGNARLILGDCREVMPLLPPVDHIITDPPYEDSFHAAKAKGRKLRTDNRAELRALDFEGIDDIRLPFIELVQECCRGWLIAFCAVEGVAKWADVINPSPIKYKRACIWVKPDSAPQLNGQGPAQGAEHFVTAWCGSGHSKWNAGGKRGVYHHLCNPGTRHGGHPTEKPVGLMAELIRDFTSANETILDPFMGSGATGIAAVNQGRHFIGVEANERYFEMAAERLTEVAIPHNLFSSQSQQQGGSNELHGSFV